MTDDRCRPRIRTAPIAGAVLVMFFSRLPSLHALEQSKGCRFWKAWLGASLPSADTVGRVFSVIDTNQLRNALGDLYQAFRRNKALRSTRSGMVALILDGHESSSSYRRHCPGCMRRQIRTARGERTQYYHRNVTALLRAGGTLFLLDAEPQQLGEDEVAAALRLFDRVVRQHPRAFDVVVVDGLYPQAPFFRRVLDAEKHVIAVLKQEERDLMVDAQALFGTQPPVEDQEGRTQRLCWDVEGFTSWPQLGRPVRVVRSLETFSVIRQKDGCPEEQHTEWVWVTTLPIAMASTRVVINLGHGRWGIENEGFNELVNAWNADHVYRHHPTAILNFTLMAFLAYNLFHAFVSRNLKPQLRNRYSCLHWARLILSELYVGDWKVPLPLPP